MLTGLYKLSNNNYRYFNVSTGFMYTGLVKHGRYYYYFNPRTGYRFQGGMKKIGGRTYYFKSNGRAHTGWLTLKGKKYFFNARGIMYSNTTVMVQGKKYKFASNGVAVEIQDKWTKLLDRYKNNSTVKQLIFVQYEGGTRARILMYEKKEEFLNRRFPVRDMWVEMVLIKYGPEMRKLQQEPLALPWLSEEKIIQGLKFHIRS